MARPTKLTKELVDKASKYLGTCIGKLPTKEGLSLYLDVSRETLYQWKDLKTDLGRQFSDIFDEVMAEQGERLVQGGIYGKFNPTITKLMLSKHDYIEATKTDVTSDGKQLANPYAELSAADLRKLARGK